MLTLAQAQALLPGAALIGDGGVAFARVHSDTRSLRAGDLFVALRGERFDAHDFLAQARQAGAVAALAERGLETAGLPGLQVADALAALQQLAAAWRARFTLPLIAVTGSNGKTTVTQMIASILRAAQGEAAFATEGNLNNHIGLPLTLLRLRESHRVGVVELGMNHPGEIALLAKIAAPTVALVNNAQREHQEFMATVEAAARENGAAIEALGPQGIAVFPGDDEFTPLWRQLAGARTVRTFALQRAAEVRADAQWQGEHWAMQLHTPAGMMAATLRMAGQHNLKNALAATACALAAGVPLDAVARGLTSFEPVKGRSRLHRLQRGARTLTLVDDSYNANRQRARSDRRARVAGQPALAAARRHGRGRHPGAGLPCRGRRLRPPARHRTGLDGGRGLRQCGPCLWHRGAALRHGRRAAGGAARGAGRGLVAGQGLALHANGACRAGTDRGDRPCCLA
jgi:UDP-N-acetylmuramoyl-tripeptide--D-alanyl-D-alanine ligase